jgi:hypothetical protein
MHDVLNKVAVIVSIGLKKKMTALRETVCHFFVWSVISGSLKSHPTLEKAQKQALPFFVK